jgi:hypothetical protein
MWRIRDSRSAVKKGARLEWQSAKVSLLCVARMTPYRPVNSRSGADSIPLRINTLAIVPRPTL